MLPVEVFMAAHGLPDVTVRPQPQPDSSGSRNIEANPAASSSNARSWLKNAAFPVAKTLEEFDRGASTIPAAALDYLACLEWVTAPREPVPGRPGRHRQEPPPARRPGRRGGAGWAQGPLPHRRGAG
jgi:hypothetical protein